MTNTTYNQKELTQLQYIQKGKIGCTFASVAATMLLQGKDMQWQFAEVSNMDTKLEDLNLSKSTVSILFPDNWSIATIRHWLSINNFTEEIVTKGSLFNRIKRFLKGEKLIGIRYTQDKYTSWVMYFGPDAHCPTRQTPHKMITFRIKVPKAPFYKVGFKNNILHIAQMSTLLFNVAKNKLERLWKTSHKNSHKIVGESLNEEHAAKTTFKI